MNIESLVQELRRAKILVVDDAPDSRLVCREYLESRYEVIEARNGYEALRLIDAVLPDLILLDILMPEMDGFCVLETLRGNARRRSIPVVCLTTALDEDVESRCFDLGAVDYIPKPIRPTVLLARVNNHLVLARLRNALVAANNDLESKVAERTRELKESLHDAISADSAKSAFLRNVSHELRTPMNVITGMSALISMDEKSNRETRYYAQTIHDSARHLMGQLDDIFSMTTAEAIVEENAENFFPPYELAKAIDETFRARAVEKRLDFRCQVAEDVPEELIGAAGRFQQVLIKIVDNALKFTIEGSIRVDFAFAVAPERLLVSVSDTGCGIPNGRLPKLFEPFTQGDESLTREHGGLGLGLALARRWVTQLLGSIEMESAEGIGTTVRIAFPVVRQGMP